MQEIICLLDVSGSMSVVASDAVGGYNKFLEDQQAFGEANLTVIWFDHKPSVFYEGKLSEAKPIDKWPDGGLTALYDAIGFVFEHTKERFSKEHPEKVILSILTDGEENSSKEFTQKHAADLIKEHQDKYNWSVVFLAANQDAWGVGSQLNINQQNCVNYAAVNTRGGFADYSKTTLELRS